MTARCCCCCCCRDSPPLPASPCVLSTGLPHVTPPQPPVAGGPPSEAAAAVAACCCSVTKPRSDALGCGGKVRGAGCRVQGPGCRVQDAGSRVQVVQGSGCRVQGPGLRVQGAGSVRLGCISEGQGSGVGGQGPGYRPDRVRAQGTTRVGGQGPGHRPARKASLARVQVRCPTQPTCNCSQLRDLRLLAIPATAGLPLLPPRGEWVRGRGTRRVASSATASATASVSACCCCCCCCSCKLSVVPAAGPATVPTSDTASTSVRC